MISKESHQLLNDALALHRHGQSQDGGAVDLFKGELERGFSFGISD